MERRRRSLRAATLLVVVVAGGRCGGGEQHAPTVRIALAPGYVPLHDGFQTDVILDGSASRDQVSDPDGKLPLAFRWEVDDPDAPVVAGTLGTARLTVRLAAEAPTRIRLTVTSSDGSSSATATSYVGVTAPR